MGVFLVFGKNDGFSQLVATTFFYAIFQHIAQGLDGRISIEQPLVQFVLRNPLVSSGFFPIKYFVFKGFFFFIRKLVVPNALGMEFSGQLNRTVRHQMVVFYSFFKGVGVGWGFVCQAKHLVSVSVYTVFGRGGKPQENGVKILKNSLVFFIDRTVGFVYNNQIKMPYAVKPLVVITATVYKPHHGLVG